MKCGRAKKSKLFQGEISGAFLCTLYPHTLDWKFRTLQLQTS
jgi:hypothetical protein